MASQLIRNLDDSVITKLNELADKKKISREQYLREILNRLAVSEELRELDNKYNSLVQLLSDRAEMMNDIIEKNTYILEKIIEKS